MRGVAGIEHRGCGADYVCGQPTVCAAGPNDDAAARCWWSPASLRVDGRCDAARAEPVPGVLAGGGAVLRCAGVPAGVHPTAVVDPTATIGLGSARWGVRGGGTAGGDWGGRGAAAARGGVRGRGDRASAAGARACGGAGALPAGRRRGPGQWRGDWRGRLWICEGRGPVVEDCAERRDGAGRCAWRCRATRASTGPASARR